MRATLNVMVNCPRVEPAGSTLTATSQERPSASVPRQRLAAGASPAAGIFCTDSARVHLSAAHFSSMRFSISAGGRSAGGRETSSALSKAGFKLNNSLSALLKAGETEWGVG